MGKDACSRLPVICNGSSGFTVTSGIVDSPVDGSDVCATAALPANYYEVIASCSCISTTAPAMMELVVLDSTGTTIISVIGRATTKSARDIYYDKIHLDTESIIAWRANEILGSHDDYVLAEIAVRLA